MLTKLCCCSLLQLEGIEYRSIRLVSIHLYANADNCYSHIFINCFFCCSTRTFVLGIGLVELVTLSVKLCCNSSCFEYVKPDYSLTLFSFKFLILFVLSTFCFKYLLLLWVFGVIVAINELALSIQQCPPSSSQCYRMVVPNNTVIDLAAKHVKYLEAYETQNCQINNQAHIKEWLKRRNGQVQLIKRLLFWYSKMLKVASFRSLSSFIYSQCVMK